MLTEEAVTMDESTEPWRFFYDSQKTLDSLIIEKKREYLRNLMFIDDEYNKICKKLENQLEGKVKNINEKCEAVDKLDIELDKVRSLIFIHEVFSICKC